MRVRPGAASVKGEFVKADSLYEARSLPDQVLVSTVCGFPPSDSARRQFDHFPAALGLGLESGMAKKAQDA